MTAPTDIDAWFEKANNHLTALTTAHHQTWKIGDCERWDADQDTGILTWSFADGIIVTAPFQIVGTYSTEAGSFLWGWDHPSVQPHLRADAAAVLAFAKEQGIDFLQDRMLGCSEEAAWQLAALATLLCDRQGAYRGPADSTLVFMTFSTVNIRKAS